jgi:hypothetical protein
MVSSNHSPFCFTDIGKGVKARLESISDFMKSVEVSWNLMKYSDVNWPKSHGVSWSQIGTSGAFTPLDIGLYKEVFTLTFHLYFKNFPEVSPILNQSF